LTPVLDVFLAELARRVAALPLMPDRNACHTVARIGAELAREMGIGAVAERGSWTTRRYGRVDPHAWLRIGDVIIHSRRRTAADTIELEALPASGAFVVSRGSSCAKD
jgi:hypothetical protein